MLTLDSLRQNPNELATSYSHFGVSDRLAMTGHSHQAWPDCALEGQQEAWFNAAKHIDEKWDIAFAKADRVRQGFAKLLDDNNGYYALGANTHELVVRFLSALPLKKRPKIVTTDGEYHTLRRQLARLGEEGIEVVRVASDIVDEIPSKIIASIDDQTAAVFVSSVLFQTGLIVPGFTDMLVACQKHGAEFVIDTYHSLNVVPFSLRAQKLDEAFVVGGGYKYCQLGEGNCFLRIPKSCTLRPVVTGWYSEYSAIADKHDPNKVVYGNKGDLFAGATYDTTSHFRAAKVFEFFVEKQLSVEFLRDVNQHQVKLLAKTFDELNIDSEIVTRDHGIPFDKIGGFLTLRSAKAGELQKRLRDKGVLTDSRANCLRFGPAPYHCDDQLIQAMNILGSVCAEL